MLHGPRDKAIRNASQNSRRKDLVAAESRAALAAGAFCEILGGKVTFYVLEHAKLDGYAHADAKERRKGALEIVIASQRHR